MKPAVAAGIAALAAGVGLALWWAGRPEPRLAEPSISGAALYATTFRDAQGTSRSLGQFQGHTLVLNFWATWCAPCREEMPALVRLNRRWRERGVAFVGISDEPPEVVARFARELGIDYALWSGAGNDLSRRLGDRQGFIPFTAVIDRDGRVFTAKVGPYSEAELDAELQRTAGNSR